MIPNNKSIDESMLDSRSFFAVETSSVLDNSDRGINLQAIGKSGVSGKTRNKEAGRIDRGIAASFSTQSDHNRRTIQIPSTQPSGRRIGDGLHG